MSASKCLMALSGCTRLRCLDILAVLSILNMAETCLAKHSDTRHISYIVSLYLMQSHRATPGAESTKL